MRVSIMRARGGYTYQTNAHRQRLTDECAVRHIVDILGAWQSCYFRTTRKSSRPA